MRNTKVKHEKVAMTRRNGNGSGAGGKTLPRAVAIETDEVYEDYLKCLPTQTAAIVAGEEEWERRMA